MTLNPKNLQPGCEQWEKYYSHVLEEERVQYDYRDHDGKLFSCIAKSLQAAREKRDKWLTDVTKRK